MSNGFYNLFFSFGAFYFYMILEWRHKRGNGIMTQARLKPGSLWALLCKYVKRKSLYSLCLCMSVCFCACEEERNRWWNSWLMSTLQIHKTVQLRLDNSTIKCQRKIFCHLFWKTSKLVANQPAQFMQRFTNSPFIRDWKATDDNTLTQLCVSTKLSHNTRRVLKYQRQAFGCKH